MIIDNDNLSLHYYYISEIYTYIHNQIIVPLCQSSLSSVRNISASPVAVLKLSPTPDSCVPERKQFYLTGDTTLGNTPSSPSFSRR